VPSVRARVVADPRHARATPGLGVHLSEARTLALDQDGQELGDCWVAELTLDLTNGSLHSASRHSAVVLLRKPVNDRLELLVDIDGEIKSHLS
jgi:hypothetical protein